MKSKTINIAPTWTGILPTLTYLIKQKRQSDQHTGYTELNRCAQAADRFNRTLDLVEKQLKKARKRERLLNHRDTALEHREYRGEVAAYTKLLRAMRRMK